MAGFIAVLARRISNAEALRDAWTDASTEDYYVFESAFATVRLRKRQDYPATYVNVEGSKLCCGYGRRDVGEAVANAALKDIPEAIFYDEEFLFVAADCHTQSVALQRDAFSTVPLYAGRYKNVCAVSNDFAFIVQANPAASKLDEVALAEVLLGRETYHRTLSEDISLLYDRQRLTWSHGKYHHEMPPNAQRAMATKESDPKQFGRLLEATVMKYWQRYGATDNAALTLSYGLDSSLVAAILADNHKKPLCVTALYPDMYGESVLAKAHDFAARFGVESYLYPMQVDTDFPLSEMINDEWVPQYHGSGMYDAVFKKLAHYAAAAGKTCIFLGEGGDELCENIPDIETMRQEGAIITADNARKRTWLTEKFYAAAAETFEKLKSQPQPVPILSVSTASSATALSNSMLEYNLWPVSPLCDPVLHDYCQRLPHHYRYKKAILQAYGKARRLPDRILDVDANEDFAPFFDYAVARNLGRALTHCLQTSVLEKLGYINAPEVLETFRKGLEKLEIKGSEPQDHMLYEGYTVLKIEMALRSMELDKAAHNLTT